MSTPVQLITLDQWAEARYGTNKPHPNTLRRWARQGNIYPRPRKHGKPYMVVPTAAYVDPADPKSLAGAMAEASIPTTRARREPEPPAPINWPDYLITPAIARQRAVPLFEVVVRQGVYLILDPNKRGVAYVGSSVDVANACRSRHFWSGITSEASVVWIIVANRNMLTGIEAAYYRALSPRLNRRSPPRPCETGNLEDLIRQAWGRS